MRIRLAAPQTSGAVSLEATLQRRRSVRDFTSQGLTLEEASQLLWAAQGLSSNAGLRTAPSAGALYPLETYLVAGSVQGLKAGIYRYRPEEHALVLVAEGDRRGALGEAAYNQDWLAVAPASVVLTAVYERTKGKYGERGVRYAQIEVGHAAQNLLLQAVSLKLGSVFVGAFRDAEVRRLLNASEQEQPLAILPVGHPKRP